MKLLHLDTNHPLMISEFAKMGYENHEDYTGSKEEIESRIHQYDGIIIRSRFTIDRDFLDKATNLKFIGRVGAGLENIDTAYATSRGVFLAAAPEGNRNAVGEHSLGMLLSLFNKLNKADREVRQGVWDREGNRGLELDGKCVGIIGYGNMGKAFARKLKGFEVEVLCYDIKPGVGDENARQVSLDELRRKAQVLSLHVPQTPDTVGMVDSRFINGFRHPFWIINTARGKCIVTKDLVNALESGKILGAGLDVLEYEKASFEKLFQGDEMPEAFRYLVASDKVLLTPHVGGWTVESKEKLAQTIVDKVHRHFHNQT
ncbi:2-hydroxyacid dehydrogenase [Zeaxanthinibacter enoshimensis]|uniref:D-3-phosphoglycerate dehydrogenase n=1 Tax=Zeaxanthinibacter enoshimensis TaxID=392009 RepID=A0A4V3D416_9FLAO|nr:2-hydroxyacid dehydrogenase [Zeaxanthinibacter enoshimensis]TDQ32511.1 D-3-phosphoglycerate dehydrogenase [Zeaxanthinibacter enoshimensis]